MTADLDLGVDYEVDAQTNGNVEFAAPDFYDEDDEEVDFYEEDDDEADFFDDDDDEVDFYDDDEEFLGGLVGSALSPIVSAVAPHVISSGASAVKNLVNTATKPFIRKKRVRPSNYARRVRGTRRGSIMTSRGPIRAQFSKSFVTSSQLKSALAAVRRDVGKVSSRISSTHSQLGKQIRKVSKSSATGIAAEVRSRTKAIKKAKAEFAKKIDSTKEQLEQQISESQTMAMMMSLLNDGSTMDSTTMMVMAMSMSGSGDSSSDLSSNPLLLLALSDAFS